MSIATIPITVVVPVKNEERNLPRCLAALARFSEVVVADSGSTDRTAEIARAAGARVLEFVWDGRFPKKRNWVLLSQRLSNGWVLFLDADEFVDDRFCDEVTLAIAAGHHDAYWLNYTNYFLGRRLRYGVPQRKLALLKVGKGLYERIEEDSWSELDMEVHEHPIVEGTVGEIRAPIEHNDDRGVAKFIDRHLNYAKWEAHRTVLLERQARLEGVGLTRRQRLKYRNIESWWYPGAYFFYTYLVRLGVLDGAAGFRYAVYKSWYFLTVRLLIRELREKDRSGVSRGHQL